jgi:uncharacterized protein YPO0396
VLIDARRQQEVLAPLPELQQELQRAEAKRRELEAEKASLPVYFAEQRQRLWAARAGRIAADLAAIELSIEQLSRAESDAAAQVEARHAEYLQAGGGRIEDLKKDIVRAREHLEQIAEAASRYQQTARALGLDDRLLESSVRANLEAAQAAQHGFEKQRQEAQDRFGAAAAVFSTNQQQGTALRAELQEVQSRPNSAIDPKFQEFRDRVAKHLGFSAEDLMFIGELIDVKDEARAWQGAIERALGGLRLTLTVPEERFRLVTGWLNANHAGLHVRAQVVREFKVPPRFKEDGFLRKLEWRQHPYRDWLKQHLARFDLACVPDSVTLDATPFSLTQTGLIHRESGRFEKRDLRRIDDRSEWYLGFSNSRRLALVQSRIRQQEADFEQAERAALAAREFLNATDKQLREWQELLIVRWDRIDMPRARHLLKEHEQSLRMLEEAGGDLARARERWEAAKSRAASVQEQLTTKRELLGETRSELKRAQTNQEQAQRNAVAGMADEVRERLTRRLGSLDDGRLEQLDNLESDHRNGIELALAEADGKFATASRKCVGIMSAYRTRDEWRAFTAEWGSELLDLSTYVDRLSYIEREGLPQLVEEFRERLNRHATHSLAGIRSQINNEMEDIRERIETINKVLARTEFRHGTHLRLKAELDEYEHVRDFNRQLQAVMQATTGDDHEARFAGLEAVVAILEKATSPASGYTKESQRLLDPRYRLSFIAEDIDTASGQVVDVLASPSGKSGGEKEAFAGTVVAASLAYVLTPDGADEPIYCTVFLDEAFSNTAEAVSRRVLRVFRELQIHVNLITPFKNLNLARESARSLLIAERDQQRHESRLCQVTWEEIDEQLARRATSRPEAAAALAGVDLKVASS